MSLRIVIPGGSGQVGTMLARHFHAQGHAVTVLSRNPRPAPWKTVAWDGTTPGSWTRELEDTDVCINLSGRSVNCRYNAKNRKEIYESRIRPTQLLNEVIGGLQNPPRVWLNASTATIYRHALDRPMDEATGEFGGDESGAPRSWSFSLKVAKDWEAALFANPTPHIRKIALRSAVVMNPERGSIFDVLLSLVRRGLGGTVGSGRQYVSWIHEADFVRAIDWLILHEDFDGVVNLSSPHPLPNRDFMRILREAWGTRIGLPAPAWLLEIGTFLLRTESELVLKSRRVIPTRLLNTGFTFQFPNWPEAAQELVSRWRALQ
jgi:uncharacterized protein